MKFVRTVVFVALLALAACATIQIKGDPAREVQADRILALVIANDTASVLAQMPPELDKATAQAQLSDLRDKLPKTPPPPAKTISFTRVSGTGGDQYFITRLYEFPTVVVVTQSQMVKTSAGQWLVANFNFNSATHEELKANDFTLVGKTPVHYALLASMVLVASLIVVTVGFALYRRRWGWAIFSLFGFVAFQLNWATGQWALQPLQFYFLGAAAVRAASPFSAWVFAVAFPLGAILFWALGKNTAKPPKTPKARMPAREPFVSTPDDFNQTGSPADAVRPPE